jgi:hypothetical protein
MARAAGRRWNWNKLSLREKRYYRLPPPALFRCRLCKVQVTAIDRQGHVDRSHPGGDVLVVFAVVRR